MRAQNIAQRRIHQVRSGVIANDARAAVGMGHDRNAIADAQRVLRHNFVCDESRDGIKCARYFREQLRFRIVVERARVRHLPAGLGINRRAVEDNFAAFARLQLVDRCIFRNDRFNPRILRRCPMIEVRLRREAVRNLCIRRIRRLLRPAFPRRAAPLLLQIHCVVKASPVDIDAFEACSFFYDISSKTKRVV